MLALLALFGTVSSLDPSLTFHYVKHPRVFRRHEVACQVCYGEFDCLSMDRCGYNAAVSELLHGEDYTNYVNDGLRAEVDSMMYDLILEDSLKEYNECIPLISSHTTCNKENICLGCKSCSCDEHGRWNCTDIQKCSDAPLIVDHRVLMSVVDSLKDSNTSRFKRSYDGSEESTTRNFFDDLLDWGDTTAVDVKVVNTITTGSTTIVSTTASYKNITEVDNNNLVFDDILSNDNLEHFIKYSERELNNDDKHYNQDDSYQFLTALKNIEEGREDRLQIDNPRRNIELLKDLQKYIKDNPNANEASNEQPNSINAILIDTDSNDDKQTADTSADIFVLKRKVRALNETMLKNQTKTSNLTQALKKEAKTITYSEKELQHIIDVLTVLINNERKQINHLNYVKDTILKLMKKHKTNSSVADTTHNQKTKNHINWKTGMLNFYMTNLKRDVKDTLRDIYAIHKLKKLGVEDVAESVSNLKPLLFALTSYYMKNFKNGRLEHTKKYNSIPNLDSSFANSSLSINMSSVNQIYDSEPEPQRRVMQTSFSKFYHIKLIRRALSRIMVIIDNDILSADALSPLSPTTRNIFKRIVNEQFTKDFADVHPSIRDPNFNLTKLLTTLVEKWQNLPAVIHRLSPADRLYNMKLMHLSLSQGIDKIKDAIISIQFGYNRRMNFIEEHVGKNLIADISKFLATVNSHIIGLAVNAIVTDLYTPKRRDQHTGSVWHHIKNAFSNSKHSLIKYFNSKLKPKSYIVNEQVKKRAEEVNRQKFLEVMKRWQENFDSYRVRSKRSVKHYGNRMKNIIPKYLRGIKANTALNAKLNQNKIIKLEAKGPVHQTLSKSARPLRHPKHFTLPPTAKYITVSSTLAKRATTKALPHLGVRTSHRPILKEDERKARRLPNSVKAREKKKGRVPIHQPLKGQPKRGVRNQHVLH